MTRYYFDENRSGTRTEDNEGIEFATAEEADRHALARVIEFMQSVTESSGMNGLTVRVHTEDYSTVWNVASTVRRIGSLKPDTEKEVRPGTQPDTVAWLMDRGDTNEQVLSMAVDAFLADPTRRWFEIAGAYEVDLLAAVQSCEAAASHPGSWLLVRLAILRAPIKRR